MWAWLNNCFEALLSYSPMALIIGIIIIGLSMFDAFLSKKHWKERWSSVAVAVLSVWLLLVQGKSSELADQKAGAKLQGALQQQRDDLTKAFKAGTDQVINSTSATFKVGTEQVIKATSDTANQTRKSATDQTNAIKQQASDQFGQLQNVMVGTSMCPIVVLGGNATSGKPNLISVVNEDPKLNMYDIRLELMEFGPDQTSGHDEQWNKIIWYQVVTIPQAIPHWALQSPIEFKSKMTDIHVEFRVTTRAAANCAGSINLFDNGTKGWMTDSSELHQGNKTLSSSYMHLSPGLANSKLEPQ
jgi:hypothetical protein